MLDQLGSLLIGIASFVTVLSVVVFVHEFGHFQVARWFKVKVDSFSIGFGPELFARTSKDGIRWRLSALPLGGYVKFTGDKDEASTPDFSLPPADRSSGLLHAQPVGIRAAVVAAGPAANFLFSIVIFALFYGFLGETVQRPVISAVLPDGAAAAAGMKAGDEVININGAKVDDFKDLQTAVMVSGGQTMQIVVKRGDATIPLTATPKIVARETPFGDMETQGLLGIETRFTERTIERRTYNPVQAIGRACEQTWNVVTTQVDFVTALVRGGMSAGHLSGPLGIGQIAGKVTENGIDGAGPDATPLKVAESVAVSLIQLMAVLSISIGFMNLLPLPVLDGGHLVFYAAEALRGKPVPEKVQAVSFRIGLVCILSLFVFATFQDLDRVGLFNMLKGIGAAG
jgi:regulator of sigma E protease